MKKYTFISTPGHGFLIVPMSEIKDAVRKGMKITDYSCVFGENAYLEEDVDAGRFLEFTKTKFEDVKEIYGNFSCDRYPSVHTVLNESKLTPEKLRKMFVRENDQRI